MSARNRLLSLIVLTCLAATGILILAAVVAAGATSFAPTSPADTPGPLPNDCQDVTGVGEDPPVCCAFGYVYYDGMPVTGAQVTIQGPGGSLPTTTSTGSASTAAYYRTSLSAAPLTVSPGETITVTATYSGSTGSAVYQATAGGQQLDIVIPQAGSQPPIGTINYIYPNPARPGVDTVAFAGSGADADGGSIAAWEWTSSLDGALSTQENFLRPAANLLAGTHTISLRVQDNEGQWSEPVMRTLNVGQPDTPTPTATACAPTNVSGLIASDTTWDRTCGPYIVTGNVLVNSGVRLTIAPGVQVRFNSGKSLQIDGELVARGTSSNPIIFTSNTSASPGAWGYILFADSSVDATYDAGGNYTNGSVLEYCLVEYAGGAGVSNNGAVRMDNAHPFINHCTITNNSASGIYAYNLSGEVKITNSVITNNISSSTSGGGIGVTGGTVIISNNTISNNTASCSYGSCGGGGGVYVASNVATIIYNTISGNKALGGSYGYYSGTDGGGGVYVYGGTAYVSSNIISNNTASLGGGGVYVFGTTADISKNHIVHNTAGSPYGGGNSGGGIGIHSSSNTTVTDNVISYNVISGDGGGIHVYGSSSTISHNIITHNQTASACFRQFNRTFPSKLTH